MRSSFLFALLLATSLNIFAAEEQSAEEGAVTVTTEQAAADEAQADADAQATEVAPPAEAEQSGE